MLLDYASVAVFMALALGFVAFAFGVSKLARPHRPHAEKVATYECGLDPVGSGWIQFNIRFYVVALVFLVFEIEAIFMFPWAVVYEQLGLFGLVEMTVFIGILLVGLAYVWGKQDLEWVKSVMGGRGAERVLPAPDMIPRRAGGDAVVRLAGGWAAPGRAGAEAGTGQARDGTAPEQGAVEARTGQTEAEVAPSGASVEARTRPAGSKTEGGQDKSEAAPSRTGGETSGSD